MSPLEGLMLVDKPKGVTSPDVVEATRRALGIRKIGLEDEQSCALELVFP